MNQNLTELVFILDKSGSMRGMEKDTIGGFNALVEKQKKTEGEVLVSTVLFSNDSTVLHDRVPLDRIPEMTEADYSVGGCTALMDALGDAIHHIGIIHKYAREEDRPAHTLFAIMTDGMENASRKYSSDAIKKLITLEQEKYGWEFLFLAANIDAVETAARYGIRRDRSVTFEQDETSMGMNFEAVDRVCASVRANAAVPEDWNAEIDRKFKRLHKK